MQVRILLAQPLEVLAGDGGDFLLINPVYPVDTTFLWVILRVSGEGSEFRLTTL